MLWARYGLAPGFELMGLPKGMLPAGLEGGAARRWAELVTSLARHCSARYGAREVAGWRWETWNEPDHRDWCGPRPGLDIFLRFRAQQSRRIAEFFCPYS